MKYALILCLLLAGCSTIVPVKRSFPDAPKSLMQECPELLQTPEDEKKLSRVIDTVVQNYSMYHECKAKNTEWIRWYKDQKKIFESVK